MSRFYSLYLHYKQGDDLHHYLNNAKGNISKAFTSWAEHFEYCHRVCKELADCLKGYKIDIDASVHFIAFYPKDKRSRELLEQLAKDGIINAEEYDE